MCSNPVPRLGIANGRRNLQKHTKGRCLCVAFPWPSAVLVGGPSMVLARAAPAVCLENEKKKKKGPERSGTLASGPQRSTLNA